MLCHSVPSRIRIAAAGGLLLSVLGACGSSERAGLSEDAAAGAQSSGGGGFGGQSVGGASGAADRGGAGGQGFGGSGGGASGGSGGGAPDLSACAAPSPCPEVTEQIGELVLPPTDAALRCVIEALRARTPGKYLQSLAITTGIGPPSATTTVHLVKADGTVHRITRTASGTSNPAVCSLPPAADFEACVESVSTDTWATPECRSAAWVTRCVAGAVDCE
jgi:hypothetical protein